MKYRTTHKKLASGRLKIYYYTEAGTRFFDCMDNPMSQPFPAAFLKAWQEAVDNEPGSGKPEGDCAQFIEDYLASDKFLSRAEATRAGYQYALDIARKEFGGASIPVMEDRRFRGAIINWQHECAKVSRRQADLNVQALSLALGYAHARGLILHNPAADLPNLYERPDDKRPFDEWMTTAFLDGASQTASDAYLLARHTGLRRTDLARITWPSWKGDYIEWTTSKGRGKRLVIIPLTPDAQSFLTGLKARSGDAVTLLTGDRGRPVQPRRIGDLVNDRCDLLGIDRTLHNLRNTYATDCIRAGFSDEDIAETLGWSIDDVKAMKRVYVARDEINAAKIRKLRTGTEQVRNKQTKTNQPTNRRNSNGRKL